MNTIRILLLFILTLSAHATLSVTGGSGNIVIPNGDTTPRTSDHTDFGTITTTETLTRTFTIKATGSQETVVGVAEDGSAWSITSGAGLRAIPAGATSNFTVKLDPTSAGYKSATITIIGSTNYTFKVEADVTGEPEIKVLGQVLTLIPPVNISDGDSSPSGADGTAFGNKGVSAGSISHIFTIENNGDGQLDIDSITDDSSHFSISGEPSVVGVNQSKTFNINFNPSSAGTHTATITIQNNDANEDPFTFSVSGTGQAPAIQVLGGTSQSINITNGDDTPRTTDGTNFGTVAANAPDKTNTFKIKNTGTENLIVTIVSEDANAFRLSSTPSPIIPIAPGSSDNFNIILDANVAGTKHGTVTIQSNDPSDGIFTFEITAEVTGDPEIKVEGRLNPITPFVSILDNDTTPNALDGTDFGDIAVGDTFAKTFRISNTGNAKLNIDSILETSNQFRITNKPTSVAAGNEKDITITFAPTSTGVKSTTVTIENDDPNEDPFTFKIEGNGEGGLLEIQGGAPALVIPDGDTTPRTADHTDFGSVDAGIESRVRTFTLKNTGNANLLFTTISEDGAAFSITAMPTAGTNIAPNSTRTFDITFAPTSSGSKSATVLVHTTVGIYSFDIAGTAGGVSGYGVTGTSGGILPFTPVINGQLTTAASTTNGTEFGSLAVSGGAVTHQFQITNTGTSQLDIDEITVGGSQFTLANIPSVVGVNQSKIFNVIFNPTSAGVKSPKVRIFTDGQTEETFIFSVRGTGTASEMTVYDGPTDIEESIVSGSVDPPAGSHRNFGSVPAGVSITRTFLVKNTGNSNLTITAITEDGNAWSVNNASLLSIAPGNTFDLKVTLDTISAGPKAATVSIISTDPEHPLFTFEVTAQATGDPEPLILGRQVSTLPYLLIPDGSTATATINGTSFPDLKVEGESATHTFQIRNTGQAQLVINDIVDNSPHFTVTDIPSAVGVGQTATFKVTFDPKQLGLKKAIITMESNAPDSTDVYTFTVSGIGLAPDLNLFGGTGFAEEIEDGSDTPLIVDGTDFGFVNITTGNFVRTFRLKNDGTEPLIVSGVTVDHPDFTVTNQPTLAFPIPAGGFSDFEITFDPSAPDFAYATVTIVSTDPDENPYTFAIEGFGSTDEPELRVLSETMTVLSDGNVPSLAAGTDFGPVPLSSGARSTTFLLENVGTGILEITGLSENGDRFNLPNAENGTIEPGESKELEVRFSPNAEEDYTATLRILSNDPSNGTLLVNLAGSGTNTTPPPAPNLVVRGGQNFGASIFNGDISPRRFDGTDVGSIKVGESKTRTYRIGNNGNATLNLSAINLVGAPGAVGAFPATVAPQAFADVEVTFAPGSSGRKNFTLEILSDDPDTARYTFLTTGLAVDPKNMLQVRRFKRLNGAPEISFTSDPAKTYCITYSFNLDDWFTTSGLEDIDGDLEEQTYRLLGLPEPERNGIYFRVEEE